MYRIGARVQRERDTNTHTLPQRERERGRDRESTKKTGSYCETQRNTNNVFIIGIIYIIGRDPFWLQFKSLTHRIETAQIQNVFKF